MKPFVLGLLALFTLLLPAAHAQSVVDVSGRWVGTFPDSPRQGLELRLIQEGRSVTGFASMDLPGPRGPLTTQVYGDVSINGVVQLEAVHRILGPRPSQVDPRFPNFAINLQLDGLDGAGAQIFPIGEKVVDIILKRVGDDPPAYLGQTYRLEIGQRASVDITTSNMRFKLSGTTSFRSKTQLSEGACAVFAPRFDPGVLIFTLVNPEDNEGLVSVRVPKFAPGEVGVKKSYVNLCNSIYIFNPFDLWFGGLAVLVAP